VGLSKSDQAGLIEYWVNEAEEALEVASHHTQRTFRKKCTPGYSKSEMKTIKELFLWLKSQLPS